MLAPFVEGGINYGFADNSFFDQNGNRDSTKSAIQSSVGFFADARLVDIVGAIAKRPWHDDLLVGVGLNYVAWANEHYNFNAGGNSDFFTNTQGFVAVQYLVREASVREAGRRVCEVTLREGVLARARLQRHDAQRASPRPVFVLKLPAICSEAFRNRR